MAKTPSLNELHLLSPISWVAEERKRQQSARGDQNHNAFKFFSILAEEFGEVARCLEERTEYKTDNAEFRRQLEYELIQVAAVAVAWVEAIRRAEGSEQDPKCVCNACKMTNTMGGQNEKRPVC